MTELSLPMSDGNQAGHEGKRLAKAVLLFSCFTYLILTVRSTLLPSGLELLSGVRLLTTLVAAGFYLAALQMLTRDRVSGGNRQLRVLLFVTAGATVTVLLSRLAFFFATEDNLSTLAQELLLLLAWAGYFVAWVLGFLTVAEQSDNWRAARIPNASAHDRVGDMDEPVWVESNRSKIKVSLRAILWIEAEGNYVRVHHEQGSGLVRLPLVRLEESLRGNGMVRVHRSALCQRRHIKGLNRKPRGGMQLLLSDGTEVPVGRKYASIVRELSQRLV